MATESVLPLLAGIVSAIFALVVARQYAARRRAFELAWALGLGAYAAASLIEAYVGVGGWNVALYRLYFPLAGATVGLLGLGTLLLVMGRRAAIIATALVGLLVLLTGAGQWLSPVSAADLAGQGADLGAKLVPFPNPGRIAFLILNITGGLALIVGALWTWWKARRAGVLLIGLGAMLPFAGGSLSTLLQLDLRVTLQFLGIAVMFAGYLYGRELGARATPVTERATEA